MDNDAERLRMYLKGWDEGVKCLLETLTWVPADQVAHTVQHLIERSREAQV